MILTYYDTTRNFGDLLNPLIFEHYLPDFFDNDPEIIFLGIGTILGLKKGTPQTKKIIVFSSGYSKDFEPIYGPPPVIDNKYEFICTRGPLTARYFNLDSSLVVSDGALLLKNMPFPDIQKEFECSYMPHHVTENIFPGWQEIVESEGIHYISPQGDPLVIIDQVRKSKRLLAEAMHGAIVADVFRVPWIPIKSSAHINQFKWEDWALSLNMEINFHTLPSLFGDRALSKLIAERLKVGKYKPINKLGRELYKISRQKIRQKAVKTELRNLKTNAPYMSNEKILNHKANILTEKITLVKEKFATVS
jgi:succinoglycan biosynthesis protein ExoV